jgi:intracellular multiplication protein IcmB
MGNFIADIAESVATAVGSVFRTSAPSYCDIETNDSATTLVTTRGALVSGFRIDGMNFAVGPEEFEATVKALTRALQSFLTSTGHSVDFFASCDKAGVRAKLNELADGSRKTCATIGLEMDDVIASNANEIAKFTAAESLYMAIWTREALLSAKEVADGHKEMSEASLKLAKTTWSSQRLITTLPSLRERHEATVRSIADDLKSALINCEVLTSHEMLRVARMEIDPEFTQPGWRPHLLGDKVPAAGIPGYLRNDQKREIDFSDIQFPPVAWQVFPRDGERISSKYVAIGSRAFAPLFIELPQREVTPFSKLFEKLASAQIPWRCMVRIDGGGMKYVGIKDALSQLLAITSGFNKQIAQSYKELKSVEQDGHTNVRYRVSFCTWADWTPGDDMKELARRASTLAQTVQAWGQCEVREVSGDAMLGLMSTVPFVTEQSAASASTAPLAHVMRTIPIFRPASPWSKGSIIFRTMDGRLMPFQPGSSLQSTWNYIFFGRPGFGKSVQMLNVILSSCMMPGLARLPRVGIVDIGPSSQYFVDMLRESLPENLQHQVEGFKLTMAPEHSINVFDTPLGCRYPTPEHKAFIVNILSQLATPAEADKPYSRISEMASMVIDDVYTQYSDDHSKSQPKIYAPGRDPKVDEHLQRFGFKADADTAWWHVVDFLAAKDEMHAATLAQRYAVPQLADCGALSKHVTDMFDSIKVESQQTLPQAFSSLLSAAARDFPNLSSATRFDIGDVRVAAINLEEVAKTGSRAADKQTNVMYMLAAYALTKDYRIKEDTVKSMRMPKLYLRHHLKKAMENQEELKWIAYDEFHRTAKSEAVQASVLIDMREGRKYNVGVVLSSQGADDFPPTMREFATGTFVIDAGSEKNAAALQKFFGFNDTARQLLSQYVTGPKSSGAPLLAVIDTEKGKFTQLLVSTLGLNTRWALSTGSEDVLVRRQVCARLGGATGRRALAASYPNGAKKAVEALRQQGDDNPIATVVDEVLSNHAERVRRAREKNLVAA